MRNYHKSISSFVICAFSIFSSPRASSRFDDKIGEMRSECGRDISLVYKDVAYFCLSQNRAFPRSFGRNDKEKMKTTVDCAIIKSTI